MPKSSPQDQIKEARQIAAAHGMFVVDKADAYLLYRKAERPIFIGKRSNASALRTMVRKAAGNIPRPN